MSEGGQLTQAESKTPAEGGERWTSPFGLADTDAATSLWPGRRALSRPFDGRSLRLRVLGRLWRSDLLASTATLERASLFLAAALVIGALALVGAEVERFLK
jgi:hypothetical protein